MSFAYVDSMVLVIKQMRVSAEKRLELSQTIASLIDSIRGATGCGRCDFFHGLDDENIFCLLVEWDTPKNLAAHRQSECFKVLRGAINLLAEQSETTSCRSFQQE